MINELLLDNLITRFVNTGEVSFEDMNVFYTTFKIQGTLYEAMKKVVEGYIKEMSLEQMKANYPVTNDPGLFDILGEEDLL